MKFCNKHWRMLRTAIDERGMSHLVASDPFRAIQQFAEELSGQGTPDAFDPLFAAHFIICRRAIREGGTYLLMGDYCPVCEAVEHRSQVPDETGRRWTRDEEERYWIDGPADAILGECRERGLIAQVQ